METDVKMRPMYLFKLLYELTDEDHPLTTNDLVALLDEKFGIKTQRTRIRQDVDTLERFGFNIGTVKGQTNSYYYDRRIFESAELKLLIDAVQAAAFITEKKSQELTEKLTQLVPEHEAKALLKLTNRYERLKQSNEQIYYIVDALNKAILDNKRVSFCYFEYDMYKRHKLRQNGDPYELSPDRKSVV